jgi:Protein of unknown function (DUF2842)
MRLMSMRGMPQAEKGGKMRRGTRKFIGASVMIAFVPVYALVAMALAQARPVQEAAVLIQVLCYAALGIAWIVPVMPLIRWMEKPDPGT